ncbi:G-type lectin S-receptor-like serine/threonine-protein kinase LECRK2 [Eucalyptus grandis]|uniref:G-type lectin S-receptor-like serine/threonine-protein kinase LECRK2 n=1 Tax=Eucalyptus grandis TaxID=71139 RepID=UPI00192E7AB1|nr:G-type lectin S-receptor-like serine/threonine-protein kinase LECRK2 [Eucalyptus grandis]
MASVILGILLVLVPLPLSTEAQFGGNLTLGNSSTANDQNSSWLSPSGEFAFGFRRMGAGAYLLAIWLEKIEDKTIVWSANGNSLAPEGSKVQLTADGGLVLTDPRGRELWSFGLTGTGLTYAAMLDTGNFILASANHVNLWDSFNQPMDTILPTQQLNLGANVKARYSEMNYSTGRFLFALQTDGNLVLYATPAPRVVSDAYWATNTITAGRIGFRNGTILNTITAEPVPTSGYYQRAILEYDGVFRQYIHPKTANSSSGWPMHWSMVSSPVPSNICTRINRDGTGACGFNSYCTLADNQRPRCQCTPGYILLDLTNEMNGCRQDFISQSCDGSRPEKDQFALRDMLNTDWPQSDYEVSESKTEDWCREACLADCFCVVTVFKDGNCRKKKIPLLNGRKDSSVGGKALIKVRIDDSTLTSIGNGQKKNKNSTLINQATHMRTFNYQELQEATYGFKEEQGRGSFGIVYKGVLRSEDTNLVVVKVLATMTGESEKEFEREVSAIGQTNHKNLIKLLGLCNEGQHRLLVYEFMSNGTLADFLFGASKPRWYRRIEIACDVARGLSYLHEDCTKHIIHCDIKPQNILLDGSFTAKISDLGLAKLLMANQTRTTTGVRGTRGYLALEWFRNMPISSKVDVYSFGILLVELICCRKNYEPEVKIEAQIVLVDWVYDCYHDESILELVESDEEASSDIKRVKRFVMTALWCI